MRTKNSLLTLLMVSAFSLSAFGKVVEFRIKKGTGQGDWNTRRGVVEVKVGDVLRIFNDDTIDHYLHTNNDRPCEHGKRAFGPGKSYDCVVINVADPDKNTCRDHNHNNKFYVRATN